MMSLPYASDPEPSPWRGLRVVAIVVAVLVGFASFHAVWQYGIRSRPGWAWVTFVGITDLLTGVAALSTGAFLAAQAMDWRLSRLARLAPAVWLASAVVAPMGDLLFLSLGWLQWMDLIHLPTLKPDSPLGLVAIGLRPCAAGIVPLIAWRLLRGEAIGVALRRVVLALGVLATIGLMLELTELSFLQFILRRELTSPRLPAGYAAVIVIETWAVRGLYLAMAMMLVGAIAHVLGAPSLLLRIALIGMVTCQVVYRTTEMGGSSWELATGRPLYGYGVVTFDNWLRTMASSLGAIGLVGGWAVALLLILREKGVDQVRFVCWRNQSANASSDKSPAASARKVV